MFRFPHSLTLCLVSLIAASADAAQFTVEKDQQGVTVQQDGQLVARYLIRSGTKPILWPVMGPYGNEITRSYPMRPEGRPDERKDHVHHRSFWFTHGDVNGLSFWDERGRHGSIVHRKFLRVEGGNQAVIAAVNDWIGPDGKKYCEDARTLTFGAVDDGRWIDVDITLLASAGRVTFGDTKEGSFAIRVAGTMKVDAKKGGRIVNSEGETDKQAWGKPASWVDYHGPVNGHIVGIAIMNHPTSFRYPTHWHVRTYGLFAANPFGLHNFYGKKKTEVDGSYTLEPGQSFTLRYRVLIHKGDEKQGQVAKRFDLYAREQK